MQAVTNDDDLPARPGVNSPPIPDRLETSPCHVRSFPWRKVKAFMTWMRKFAFRWVAAAAILAMAASASAQSSTGAITGRAVDTSGGALPGVTVSISSPSMIGGARTAVTDAEGVYRFTQLPSGVYTVTFELPGFATLNIEGVNVAGGATMTINGRMEVAALEETVTVTSQAPAIETGRASGRAR